MVAFTVCRFYIYDHFMLEAHTELLIYQSIYLLPDDVAIYFATQTHPKRAFLAGTPIQSRSCAQHYHIRSVYLAPPWALLFSLCDVFRHAWPLMRARQLRVDTGHMSTLSKLQWTLCCRLQLLVARAPILRKHLSSFHR